METLPSLRVDVSALVLADYRNAPARTPQTPLAQLLDHVSRAAGRPVTVDEVVLSVADGLEVERRTRDFISTFVADGEAADRLMAWWLRDSRPSVLPSLNRGEALVESHTGTAPSREVGQAK